MTLERKQTQMRQRAVIGLLALAAAFFAAAARSTSVHLGWAATDAAAVRVLQVIWIIGLVLFGLAFGWLALLGRRLEAQEGLVLADEFQVLLSMKSAVRACRVMFVVAVLVVAVPGSELLPGNAVAAVIVGVGAATLALWRAGSDRI